MKNIPISQLPDADTTAGDELFPVVQGGATKKTTINVLTQGAIDATAASATAAAILATAAQTAQTNAETAETNAETAQTNAETAQTAAETARTGAQTAQTAAETAQTAAETARTGAETAETDAQTAQAAAEAAQTAAEQAETNAETAETNAQTAQTAAETARDAAAGSATTAAAEAANAASAVSYQDLTGLSETLGPSAILGAFIYDTALDSDGGAWRFKCGWTSWEREDRPTGPYLGVAANETAARAISGAGTGSCYYNSTDDNFYELDAGSGQTEVFRGPDQQFPAKALITWEAGRVIIWNALTGAMFWVVQQGGAFLGFAPNTSVSMRDGVLLRGSLFSSTQGEVYVFNFPADDMYYFDANGLVRRTGVDGTLANKAVAGTSSVIDSGQPLVSSAVLSLAQTVLPDAPINPETGLPYVTDVVGTEGAALTILDGPAGVGTAVDITHTGTGDIVDVGFRSDGALYYIIEISGVSFLHVHHSLPTADVSKGAGSVGTGSDEFYPGENDAAYTGLDIALAPDSGGSLILNVSGSAIASSDQVNFLYPNPSSPSDGAQVIMQDDNISPVMHGGTLFAGLASTDDTDIVSDILDEDFTYADQAAAEAAGWVFPGGATIASNAVSATSAANFLSRDLGLVVGQRYNFSFDYTESGVTTHLRLRDLANTERLFLSANLSGTGTGTVSGSFVALDSGIFLQAEFSLFTGTIDNFVITAADDDRSPQANHLDVTGTITRTKVATGADLVGYGGFSATDYAEIPNTDDMFSVGTGDFSVSCWFKFGSLSNISYILDCRDASTINGFGISVNASGNFSGFTRGVSFISTDGTGSYEDSEWHLGVFVVSDAGATHSIYVDGRLENQASVTAQNIVGADVGTVGSTYHQLLPVQGDLALLSIIPKALTAEQIQLKYNIERWWFQPDAIVTLDTGTVRWVDYDQALNQYHVITSGGHSVFDARTLTRLSFNAGDWDWVTADNGSVVKGD